jgi:hypothetical protein
VTGLLLALSSLAGTLTQNAIKEYGTMHRRNFFWRASLGISAMVGSSSLTGCGSILYQDRIGQPRRGPLDWKVVALDGAGLLCFFVPGVVAFAVDYYNGTLFVPTQNMSTEQALTQAEPATDAALAGSFKQIPLTLEQMNRQSLELIVSKEIGEPVFLNHPTVRVTKLSKIQEFFGACKRLLKQPETGIEPLELFDKSE